MSTPSPRKPAPATPSAPEGPDLLQVLVTRRVLTAEQVERVRRSQKVGNLTAEQAIIQLGFSNEALIAQAIAAHASPPYVKINPLDLYLDVVTKAIAGPFARMLFIFNDTETTERIT